MPLTAYPQGLSSYGMPVLPGAGGVTTSGQVFFVSNVSGANGFDNPADLSSDQGRTPQRPFKTISFAISQCKANNGDVIYVMPGHNEIIASGAKLNFNVAGVQVIGVGFRNTRPTISFNGTASIIEVNAANCGLANVILLAGVDEVVKAISVLAAFFTIDAVDVVETPAKQFIQFCLTGSGGDDLVIKNCTHHQSTAPAANSVWISLASGKRPQVFNNRIFITTTNSASSSVINSGNVEGVFIAFNNIVQLGGASVVPINLGSGATGTVAYNNVASPKTAIAGSIACGSASAAQNFSAHTVNKNGLLEPGVDT